MSREQTVEFVRVAAVDEIAPGKAKVVTVGGRPVAIFNVGGTFYAIDDACTHETTPLSDGSLYGDIVACPKHGSRFHLPTGRVLSLPAVVPVSTYPVRVDDGQIWLLPTPQKGRGMPHKV